MTNRQRWSEDEKQIIREHYRDLHTAKLAEALPGRTPGGIADMAGRLGVKKSPERLREMGREIVQRRIEKAR